MSPAEDPTPTPSAPVAPVAPGASLAASRVAREAAAQKPSATMNVLGKVARSYAKVVTSEAVRQRSSTPTAVRLSGYDRTMVVADRKLVAGDVAILTLAAPDGAELPAWSPGAHLDVFLSDGRQRQYSLNGDPAVRDRWQIAVRRIDPANGGGGGSVAMHQLGLGDTLTVRGPRNAFTFTDAPTYRFVAGGIGITPILPMARAAAAAGRDWTLIYTGRTRDSLPFLDELIALGGDRVTVLADDESGIPDVQALLGDPAPGTAVYLCGPPPMIDAARAAIPKAVSGMDHGVALHTERFSPPPVVDGKPFRLVLARTGTTIEVGADESTLSAIQRVVPAVRYSCRQGFCGSCELGVLAGEIDHRGSSMRSVCGTDSMLVCVSRAAGDELVIDV